MAEQILTQEQEKSVRPPRQRVEQSGVKLSLGKGEGKLLF